jgi:hypothetical protein
MNSVSNFIVEFEGKERKRSPRTKILTGIMINAAMLVADGAQNTKQIAEAVGVTPSKIAAWKRRKDFRAEVERFGVDIRERLVLEGIAKKGERLKMLDKLYFEIGQVIRERASDPTMQDAPGGSTGLLVRKVLKFRYRGRWCYQAMFPLDSKLMDKVLLMLEMARIESEGFSTCWRCRNNFR